MHHHYISVIESVQIYDYSGLIQNIGLGLLALLTPIALFILDKDHRTSEVDKLVLLDQVFLPRNLVLSASFIFLPQFFYDIDYLKIPVFLVFLIGFILISIILRNCYFWFKCIESGDDDNFRNQCRNRYFESNKDWGVKKNIWNLTWQDDMTVAAEVNRLNHFISNVEQLISENKIDMANSYLSSFYAFIEKRNLGNWHLFKILWSKILEWDFKYYTAEKSDTLDIPLMELQGTISAILNKVFESSLVNNAAFSCFRELRAHISDKDNEYIESLLVSPTQIFFDNITKSSSKHDIWEHYFPPEWKITLSNLSKENNFIVWIWVERFFNWAVPRFGGSNEFDTKLNAVVYGLFPSVDIATWSRILHYAFSPWVNDERIQSLLESKRTFGFISHSVSYSSPIDIDAYMDSKKIEAYKLALRLFAKEFSKSNLEKNIADLKLVSYENDTYQEHNRLIYIELFEGLLKQISQ